MCQFIRIVPVLRPSLLGLSIALLSAHSESKELLGINFSATAWHADLQGFVQSPDTEATDTDPAIPGTRFSMFELGLSAPKPRNYAVEYRHKMKNIPRIIYRKEEIQRSSTISPSRGIQFFDSSYVAGTDLSSNVDLSFTQTTLYYSLSEKNWGLDIGVGEREYDGMLQLEQEAVDDGADGGDGGGDAGGDGGDTGTDTATTLVTHPIVGKVDMAYFDINYKFSNDTILTVKVHQDIEAGILHYDSEYGLEFIGKGDFGTNKLELGYRKLIIKTNRFEELDSNLKVGGPYIRFTLAY